jgi:hypothetical protein
MLRFLKKLVGIWEPKEGVIYRPKVGELPLRVIPGAEYVQIYVQYSLDGVHWRPCTFRLKKGVYEIHAKDSYYGRTKKILLVEKKYVKAKKIKKTQKVYDGYSTAWWTDIYYRLLIKDPSKIRYLKRK